MTAIAWAQAGLAEKCQSRIIDVLVAGTYSTNNLNNVVLVYLKVGGCSPLDANMMEGI